MPASLCLLQVVLPSSFESMTTAIGLHCQSHHDLGQCFKLADLLAKDVSSSKLNRSVAFEAASVSVGSAQHDRVSLKQQSLYTSQWQAGIPGTLQPASWQAGQPQLCAILASGQTLSIYAGSKSSTLTPLAQLLQGLGVPAVRSSVQWTLAGSGGLPVPSAGSIALPSVHAAAAEPIAAAVHGMLKAAVSEQYLPEDATVSYGGTALQPAAEGQQLHNGRFGTACHSGVEYASVLLQCSFRRAGEHEAAGRPAASPSATVITGGLGGLGLITASWLQQRQELDGQHLLLLGRSGRCMHGAMAGSNDAAITSTTIGSMRTQVSLTRVDVSRAEETACVLALAAHTLPLRSILHASGVLADALLSRQTPAKFRAVAAPKVRGLQLLEMAMAQQPVGQIALYSSIAGVLGTAGQSGYAAANSAIDAMAGCMQVQGRPSTSIQWGAWAETGMAAATPQLLQRLERQGYYSVQPAAGLEALQELLSGCKTGAVSSSVVAASFAWRSLLARESRRGVPFFATILPPADEPTTITTAQMPVRLLPPPTEEHDVLVEVQRLVSHVVGVHTESRPADIPFLEAGLDSIGAMELR